MGALGAERLGIDGEHAIGLEPEIDIDHARERPDQQRGADEQDKRDGDLGRDHRARIRGGPAVRCVLAVLLQDVHRRHARTDQGRRRPEQEHRHDRDRAGEREDAPVEWQVERQVRRAVHHAAERKRRFIAEHSDEEAACPDREDDAGGGAGHRDDAGLGEQLPDQPPARRPERTTDRELLPPSRGYRHQQVGEVGAGDQQNERHQRHENRQRPGVRAVAARVVSASQRRQRNRPIHLRGIPDQAAAGHGLTNQRVPQTQRRRRVVDVEPAAQTADGRADVRSRTAPPRTSWRATASAPSRRRCGPAPGRRTPAASRRRW